ncbi:hypothetical protein BH09SUM1_BH09SUM1_27940 [soil metagenome]
MREKRSQWRGKIEGIDLDRLVFIDETGAKTNMTRRYGRAAKGERVNDSTPSGHWGTTTCVACVTTRGPIAPFLLEGAIDGDAFLIYVERVLAPLLRPGDVLVMDNLSTHKSQPARRAIEAAGARILDLPPYSPDLNPIEKMWSKLKAYLRKAAARTPEALTEAVAQALRTITIQDAFGWFRSCGYTK